MWKIDCSKFFIALKEAVIKNASGRASPHPGSHQLELSAGGGVPLPRHSREAPALVTECGGPGGQVALTGDGRSALMPARVGLTLPVNAKSSPSFGTQPALRILHPLKVRFALH